MIAPRTDLVRTYVWQLPVRLSHWLIVLSILVLSGTGLYIGHPFMTVSGEARQSFVMGWIKTIHLYAAAVFACAVVMRVIWFFTGNRYAKWQELIPVHADRRRAFLPTVSFYMFLRRKPPAVVGHNPLAGAAYVLVFGLYALAILSGLTLFAPYAQVGSPLRWFIGLEPYFGGLQTARWLHHVVMWLLLGFAVHHVYSSVLMSVSEGTGTMESIFSGYKFIEPEHLEAPAPRMAPRAD